MQAYVCRTRGPGKTLPAPPRHAVPQGWRHVSSLPPLRTVAQGTNAYLGTALGQEATVVARFKRKCEWKVWHSKSNRWGSRDRGVRQGRQQAERSWEEGACWV